MLDINEIKRYRKKLASLLERQDKLCVYTIFNTKVFVISDPYRDSGLISIMTTTGKVIKRFPVRSIKADLGIMYRMYEAGQALLYKEKPKRSMQQFSSYLSSFACSEQSTVAGDTGTCQPNEY